MIFMGLPVGLSVHNILVFLEYLHQNQLSPKVIKNYLSSITSMAKFYRLPDSALADTSISRYIRSISINSRFRPTLRGVFDIQTLYLISISCDMLTDPLLFRAVFLTAFFGFLRMSNIAPHSSKKFDPKRHFLRQDLILHHESAHLILKWTKTLQDSNSYHVIQLPSIKNIYLCPVRALTNLLSSRSLPPTAPLFANNFPPFSQIIDTHIRDALKTILTSRNIHLQGHGFHTFRRSGATYAFNHNVPLQNIMAHGLWRSSAIWTYLQNASMAASIIPKTFASTIPSHF